VIVPGNQIELLPSEPLLQRLFSCDCTNHGRMLLVPNQHLDAVSFGKSLREPFAMLPDALHEIRRDADVEYATRLIGEDIHGG